MTLVHGAPPKVNILKAQPPNIAAIRAAFPGIVSHRGLLFAYSPDIYNPEGVEISPELILHELTHMRQQAEVGGPKIWWNLYLTDQIFRLRQELEACVAEHLAYCSAQPPHNRKRRFAHLDLIAERLSSGTYGYMIRRPEAKAAVLRRIEAARSAAVAREKAALG